MPRRSPFKHHRFPRDIILCAVRWYLRHPLSYQYVVDLLAERGINVDRSTVYRWVIKFGPEITKRTEKHLRRASVDCHRHEADRACVAALAAWPLRRWSFQRTRVPHPHRSKLGVSVLVCGGHTGIANNLAKIVPKPHLFWTGFWHD